jgi:hypothetical protein
MMGEKIDGYQIDLSEGRHVFVAEREDDFLVQFRNAEGELTHLRLSLDAASALHHLLGRQVKDDDLVLRFIAHMTTKTDNSLPIFRWQEVKPETAPAPAADPR